MIRYASTFLSHSSRDADLVAAVAAELGRRGVLAWLDRDELYAGQDLPTAISRAVQGQATLSIFLSETALRSAWVTDELTTAIDKYEAEGRHGLIKPVYLDVPLGLVRGSPVLRRRWLHPDGSRVTMLGVVADPTLPTDSSAALIANDLAGSVFRALAADKARNIVIHIDQRGSSRRGPANNIPPNLEALDGVGLVFRPSAGPGAQKETIVAEEWATLAKTMTQSLSDALRQVRWPEPKQIYVSGHAQLGLAYLIGYHFDRSTNAVLHCSGKEGEVFSNLGWERSAALSGGNPHCEGNADYPLPAIPSSRLSEVVVVIGRRRVLAGALSYLTSTRPGTPVAWIRTSESEDFVDSHQVRDVVADLTAFLDRMREQGCVTAYFVLGLPFAAVPLVAAHMLYVMPRIVLLEYRGDASPGTTAMESYAELELPVR